MCYSPLVNSTTEQAAEITRLVGEYHDLIDALADEKRAVEQGEAAYKRFLEIIAQGNKDREAAERARLKAIEDEIRAEKERTRTIREEIRQGEEYATSVIQVANAFGFLDDEAARALESVVQIGAAVARIAILNDPTAIPSLIGGLASLFGGGPSQAEIEALRFQEENNRLMEENTRSLERLRELLAGGDDLTRAEAQTGADAVAAQRKMGFPFVGAITDSASAMKYGIGFGGTLLDFGLSLQEFSAMANSLDIDVLDDAGRLIPGSIQAAGEAFKLWVQFMQETEDAFNQNLEIRRLSALGMDKEAEALRLQIRQEQELAEARAQGFEAETIAAIEEVQALEKVAEARREEMRAMEALQAFQRSLNLGPLSTLSPSAQLDEARRIFEETRASALGGDAEASGRLPADARAFLDASRAFNASGPGFAADFAAVQAANDAAIDLFGEQLSVNENILKETQSQTEELRNIVIEGQASVRVQAEGFTRTLENQDSILEAIEELIRVTQQGGEVVET